jgi:ATP-dependent DNA helicase PIF1
MLRRQFSLKLAYALTVNCSQGQEFEKLLVDSTLPPFTHDDLYVALSRIRTAEIIKIYCTKEVILDINIVLAKNVVYDEILNNF